MIFFPEIRLNRRKTLARPSSYGFVFFLPREFVWLSKQIGNQAELLRFSDLLPVGLVVYDSKVVQQILMPDADNRNVLQRWELYKDFKCGCIVGLFYGALFGITGAA